MTKRDIAGYLNIDRTTLYNWEKNKPNLYKTVMKGLAFNKLIDNAKENYEKLIELDKDCGSKDKPSNQQINPIKVL